MGEIVLIVIGILIALQINIWNEARKTQRDVHLIKQNLKNEFQQNRYVLKDRIELLERSLEHARIILGFFIHLPVNLPEEKIDSILVNTLYYDNFNPSNSSIQELIQSGGLKILSDDSLKNQLFDWMQMIEDTDEDFKNQDLHATQYLTPYLNTHISHRNLDLQGKYSVTDSPTILLANYYKDVFQDFEFENLMINHMFWHTIVVRHYYELDSLALEILESLER